jgi:hypothetical protein
MAVSQPSPPEPPPSERPLEEREVKAADPTLSEDTNRLLTRELREVIGSDHARVPRDRPRASRGERPRERGFAAFWNVYRLTLTIGLLIVLTFAAILALTTGYWWILGVACGVHAMGTTGVWFLAWRTTTISEHPAPTVAAAMSEEGVRTPDEVFSRMVDEFRPEPEPGVEEAVAPVGNQRETPAHRDPARAGAEQASALTPTGQPSEGVRYGGPTDFMIWTVNASLAVSSLVIAAAEGGWMWLLPAIVLPLVAGLTLLQWLMDRRPDSVHPRSWKPLGMIVAGAAVTVGVFCALIALFIH